jgi:RNA polymerase sigma factor FliA
MRERSARQEQLILEHLPGIKFIAARYSNSLPPYVDVRDLVGEGVLGLLTAAARFDPERGVKFKTYAESRIRGAILDSLRGLDWVPRSLRRKLKRLRSAAKELEQRLGRQAMDRELADALGIALEKTRKLRALSRTTREPAERDGTERAPLAPQLIDRRFDALVTIQQQEMQRIIARAIAGLPARERLVISLYYYDGLTMREIGGVLGVNESRVSQYHSQAKGRLCRKLNQALSADPRIWLSLE